MAELHRLSRPVRILDIASGPGRYVLETMKAMANSMPASALCRYRQNNLDAATALAEKLEVGEVVVAQGDAFDRESLAAVTPRPTIAIVSGLYELIPDNEAKTLRSLRGIADAMGDGGFLIYTNQPWRSAGGIYRARAGESRGAAVDHATALAGRDG